MNQTELQAAQAAMRRRVSLRNTDGDTKRPIRSALKKAKALRRAIRKKKKKDRERYRSLTAERRTLNTALRSEYKTMLAEFRTLCGTMREAEQVLRGVLGDREKQSATFLKGLEAGREEARMQRLQAQLDQQSKGQSDNGK